MEPIDDQPQWVGEPIAALAVRNAQIFEAQRRTADRQTSLYQVLCAVSGQLDPDAVAKSAVEVIVKFAGWPHVCIAVPTRLGTHWEIRAAGGELADEIGRTLPMSQGVIGRVFRTAQTQLVRDVRTDPDYRGDHPALCCELAVPIKQGERVLAVLNLESDRLADLGADEVQLAEALAEAIALALDHARLVERTQLELAERKQAKERLRLQSAALEAAANGIVITDRNGCIVWVNPAFTRLTGYTSEEAIGQNPRILKSGLHDHAFYQNLWNTILDGQVWHDEVMNRRKDGSLYMEEMTLTPVRSTGDEITHFVAIKQDITERKWTENKLRETKDQLEAILQGVADGINVLDATGRLIYVNEAAARAAGYPSTQAMLRDYNPDTLITGVDLLDESGHPFPPDQLPDRLVLQGKQARATTLCYRTKATGEKRWSVVQAAPIFDEYGQVQFIVSITHDLTQHKQAEVALRGYATELEARNEELDAFAHTVAHDLKNPLSHIIGYSELLEAEGTELSADELNISLRAIVRTVSKMNNIVDELLLLAGVRNAEAEINPLDMAVIVTEAQRRLDHMITRQQASVIAADRWPVALGHAPWVEEVWVNYISNAIKYGGQPPHIELGAEAQPNGMVRFWVRDNGDGLAPEAQARLFTPFTRLDQVRARGHGLGLSIVRRIVEKLGGQVGVESDGVPGHGCVFYFRLPGAA